MNTCDYINDDEQNDDNDDSGGDDTDTNNDGDDTNNSSSGDDENSGGGGEDQNQDNNDSYDPEDPSTHGNNPILTNTNFSPPEKSIDEKNCDELNRITNSPYLTSKFIILRNNLNQNQETGYKSLASPNYPYFTTHDAPLKNEDEVAAGAHPLSFNFYHNHYIGKYEMFGHGDIHTLYKYAAGFSSYGIDNFTYDQSLFTVFMTVRDHTYAIKIDNLENLATIQQIFNNKKLKKEFINDLRSVYQDINYDPKYANQNDLAKAFLKFTTETHSLGISLYKAKTNNIINRNSDWKKLTLDTNGDLKPTPCN